MSTPPLPQQQVPILQGQVWLIAREWWRFFVSLKDYAIAQVGQLPGTTTSDDAQQGNIGEYLTAAGTAISLTNATSANVAQLVLTAGDWDVWGVANYTFDATTSFTKLQQGLSKVSAAFGSRGSFSVVAMADNVPNPSIDPAWPVPTIRVSTSAPVTVYLVVNTEFTVSTLKAYGDIFARRVR